MGLGRKPAPSDIRFEDEDESQQQERHCQEAIAFEAFRFAVALPTPYPNLRP